MNSYVCAVAIALLAGHSAAWAGHENDAELPNRVLGEKLDSGLGEIAEAERAARQGVAAAAAATHRNSVPGEKLDSGLGELPPNWRPPMPGEFWNPTLVTQTR